MPAARDLFKSVALTTILLLTLSIAASAADWKITPLQEPYSYQNVSPEDTTIQFVNITHRDTGQIITKQYLQNHEGRAEWFYTGSFVDKNGSLNYMGKGAWYTKTSIGKASGSFRFEAQRGDPIDQETNVTRAITASNISLKILTDMSQPYLPGKDDAKIEVNVTNTSSGEFLPNAQLEAVITNATYASVQSFPNDPSNQKYELYSLKIPDGIGKKYALHVKAVNGSNKATVSTFIQTMDYLNTSLADVSAGNKCRFTADSGLPAASCEPGAEMKFEVNVVDAQATNSTLIVRKKKQGGGLQKIDEIDLTKNPETGFYEGNMTVPDIDTGTFESTIYLKFLSENSYSQDVEYYNFSKASFNLSGNMADTLYQGEKYEVNFTALTPYSNRPYNESRIQSTAVDIIYPNGTLYKTVGSQNLSYNNDTGVVNGSFLIPASKTAGTYTLQARATNIYGTTKTYSHKFDLRQSSRIFNATDSIGIDLFDQGVYTKNFTIENRLESSIKVVPNITEGIQGQISVNSGKNITLGPKESKNVSITFEVYRVEDYSVNLMLKDSATTYNTTVDIELNAPDCGLRNNSLCISREAVNITMSGAGTVTKTITVFNMAPGQREVSIAVNGNISDSITVSNSSFKFYNTKEVKLNYTLNRPINLTGKILFNSTHDIRLPTSLKGVFSRPELDISSEDTEINLGIIQGQETSFEARVYNNGTLTARHFQLGYTGDRDIEITGFDKIQSGAYGNVSLNVSTTNYKDLLNVNMPLTAYSKDPQSVDKNLEGDSIGYSLTVKFMPTATKAKNKILSRIQTLRDKAVKSSTLTALGVARNNATVVEDALSKGNEEKAYRVYQATLQRLSSLADQIDENKSSGGNNNNNPGSSNATDADEGQQPGNQSDASPSDQNKDTGKGSISIIPIVLVLLILLVGGFIFYTSYVPEPGDPLYEYLGEEQ